MKQTEKTKPVKVRGNTWQRPVARKYDKDWAVEIEVGDFLYGVVRLLKPKIIIETGTFEGFSSVRMAQALKDNKKGKLFTLDRKDYGAEKMFKEYKVKRRVKLVLGESPFKLKSLILENEADFVFLDNGHEYDILTAELNLLHQYLKSGAYIAGHDYLSQTNNVGKAYDDFIKNHPNEYQSLAITGGNGIFIIRKI